MMGGGKGIKLIVWKFDNSHCSISNPPSQHCLLHLGFGRISCLLLKYTVGHRYVMA